ncbi:pikachurin [Chelonus insularis]|uniref:pikachurin n=1 Tax=Chelonus insularis TaxID=460826 RepID=UPI0015894209|nr:pikachurin [Chelonus insularis]
MAVKYFYYLTAMLGIITVTISQNLIEERTAFEAAFQGKCGQNSPCEQLCYELHDGMYECGCRDGYIIHKNGYSCSELNSTTLFNSKMDQIDDMINSNNVSSKSNSEEDAKTSFSLEKLLRTSVNQSPNDIIVKANKNNTKLAQSFGPSKLKDSTLNNTILSATENILEMEPACSVDCGPLGLCYTEELYNDRNDLNKNYRSTKLFRQRCQCPLGRTGEFCQNEIDIKSPRFTGQSWLAFPALKTAYKHIQLDLEFRPENWDGIILLTGERDDLQGDFMALILYHGFIEFRFDCGSGVGVVRSTKTVKLNKWNTLNIYRHRWDAWIQLNSEKRVQGRSKGLFSRITFQELLFIGGPGNTTGLDRLPVKTGFVGCIRHLEANEHRYRFPLMPRGDAVNGFDVEECKADKCSNVPCSHGGKCLTTGGDTTVCLCPLGYTGDLCETRVDLQIPSFNGSSYLRYPGLGDSSLSWLELSITFKPLAPDGMILYNGYHKDGTGDFIALYLNNYHVYFTFDLGSGPATLRSKLPILLDKWLEVRVSRTGRLASLEIENESMQEIMAPGAFTQLSLPMNLFLGGAPSFKTFTFKVNVTANFIGCIQTIVLNYREIGILAEALGGVNVGNCGHACESRPCGDAECRPIRDRFTCRCHLGTPHPCPALDKLIVPHALLPINSIPPISTKLERHVPSFTGTDSYLHYSDADTMKRIISYRVDINMRFRTSSTDGLLLWSGRQSEPQEREEKNNDYLALGIHQGYLVLSYNLGSGEAVLRYNLTQVNDDLWHRIKAVRNEQWSSLIVDNGLGVSVSSPGQLRELNTDTGLYIGGAPNIVNTTNGRYTKGIVGCISDLILDSDFSVVLSSPEQATNTQLCIP